MINRRIIRTKVLQVLYAFYSTPDRSINKSEKELFFSFQKSYDLYHYIMQLSLDIANHAVEVIERRKNKHFPTAEDLNPNLRFVNNRLFALLRQNSDLGSQLEQSKLTWREEPELIASLYKQLETSSFYKDYMAKENVTFADDRKVVERLLTDIILPSEDLEETLEEQSVYWNDDLSFVGSMIIRTWNKNLKETSDANTSLMPMFKDEEDRKFATDLYRKVVLNHDELKEIVQKYTKNWDVDRLALIDMLIMEMAICEFVHFTSIPTKVTLNEYIELSKYYSTQKSKTFINGVLDKILKTMKETGEIKKAGRGLIGENA
ncbi:MAG: transcription antitermination factor NusB [Mangrovibacterium sp.]